MSFNRWQTLMAVRIENTVFPAVGSPSPAVGVFTRIGVWVVASGPSVAKRKFPGQRRYPAAARASPGTSILNPRWRVDDIQTLDPRFRGGDNFFGCHAREGGVRRGFDA